MKAFTKKVLIKLGLLKQPNERQKKIRNDVEIIQIQPNLELIVYWKVLSIGRGPAVILQAYEKEILKFDCFGNGDGHFHVSPKYGKRIFFEEETALAQIERTANDLTEKAQYHLKIHKDDSISDIEIDKEKFSRAIDLAKKKMILFLQTIPELEEIRCQL